MDHQIGGTIDINAKDQQGQTAFMLACKYGCFDVVKLLLGHEVSKMIDFNIQNKYGKTAIMLANGKRAMEIVELIRENMYYMYSKT